MGGGGQFFCVVRWGGGRLGRGGGGVAYAAVETEEAVVAEDVGEGSEHAFGSIGGSCLEPYLRW